MDEYLVAVDGSEDIVIDDTVLTTDPVLVDPIEFVDTGVVDPMPVDKLPGDTLLVDAGDADVPPDAQTFGGPAVDGYDPDPDMFDGYLEGTVDPADVSTTDIFIDYVGDPVTDADPATDPAAGGPEETPGRPIDPQPEWRTLTSDENAGDVTTGEDGTTDGTLGTDGDVPPEWAYTDFVPILDKDAGGEADPAAGGDDTSGDTPPDVYTMDANDPLIYASAGGPADLPQIDPAFLSPVTVEEDIDPTPVHYAPADSFGTGLDLL